MCLGGRVITCNPWILQQLLRLLCLSPTDSKHSPGLEDKMYSLALIPGTWPVSPTFSITWVFPFSQSLRPQSSHFSDTGRWAAQEGRWQPSRVLNT